MAFTVSHLVKNVSFGNLKHDVFRVTADAATQTVGSTTLGMKVIEYAQLSPVSMTTAAGKCYINVDASGAASNGAIGISGVASGDIFFLSVYGR